MGQQVPRVQGSERILELDGLRGIAIALVLYFHCFHEVIKGPLRAVLSLLILPGQSGWTGVELFFVLSGFLIGGILLDTRSSTNYFRAFYTRRFFRIVPAYMAFLIAYYSISAIAAAADIRSLQWEEAWAAPWYVPLLFLYNFWIVINRDWSPVALSILWTLSVEEQFYLTMPWFVRFLEPKRMLRVAIGGVFVAIGLRLAGLAAMRYYVTYWSALMPCRMDSLLLGFIGAVIWRNAEWRQTFAKWKTLHRVLLILLAVGFAYYTWRPSYQPHERWGLAIGLTWTSALHFLFLMYALLHRDGVLGWVLRWGWLRWLGGIAYGVYLFHRLFLQTLAGLVWHSSAEVEVTTPRQLALYLVMFAGMLVFCRLLFVFYEQPFLKLGHRASYDSPHVSSQVQETEEVMAGV